MATARLGPVLRRLARAPTWLYRAHLGVLLGQRFLMITHRGRRSGLRYRTVVEVVGRIRERDEYVVLAGFGRSSDWLRNLQAGGGEQVAVGRRRFRPALRELPEDEAVAVLADYERRNRLIAPVVRRVLSRLVGWRYTGTAEERRRLVDVLPLVALGPGDAA
jgi:deazaflavin-dependent oxidoreductase (nitroreductase family)